MTEDFETIKPKAVPLAHTDESVEPNSKIGVKTVYLTIFFLAGLGLLSAALFLIPDKSPADKSPPNKMEPLPKPLQKEVQLPPYQDAQQERARKQAQKRLASVVKLELKLENEMSIDKWGVETYEKGKTLASLGDEYFLAADYDEAENHYEQAEAALTSLINIGESLYRKSIRLGKQAIEERKAEDAKQHLSLAKTIKPTSPEVGLGLNRATKLPEIITLWRKAENHLLADQYDSALSVFRSIESIDPLTAGLSDAIDDTAKLIADITIERHLSDGFHLYDKGDLEEATLSFEKVLSISPNNEIARTGMEQIERGLINRKINVLRNKADISQRKEIWAEAKLAYEQILEIDPKLQLATEGLKKANRHLKIISDLININASAEKLSSPPRFADAQNTLVRAKTLASPGPQLQQLINKTGHLLNYYGRPLSVTLLSDDETNITITTIGNIGPLKSRVLALRPGEYTLIGSRNGFHDIRKKIIVKPNFEPIEIKCEERL